MSHILPMSFVTVGRRSFFCFPGDEFRKQGWRFSPFFPTKKEKCSPPDPGGDHFDFSSKFLSYRGRSSPAGQWMNNFLPGESYDLQSACRTPT